MPEYLSCSKEKLIIQQRYFVCRLTILPYQQQFFICERGYIEYLGLNPDDANWRKIAYNWVEPENLSAWQELNQAYANLG